MLSETFLAFGILDGIDQTIGDLGFVVKLIALVYLIYVCYITFADNQVLFGGSALLVSWFILFYSPLVLTFALVIFVAINPYFFQNLYFGSLAIQQIGDIPAQEAQLANQKRLSAVEEQLAQGDAIDPDELAWYQSHGGGAAQQEMQAQAMMGGGMQMGMNGAMGQQAMMNMMRRR